MIPLGLLRPLRLCLPAEKIRSARIILLKATHWPYVAAIYVYEIASGRLRGTVADWLYNPKLYLNKRPPLNVHRQHRDWRYSGLGNRSEASLTAKNPTNENNTTITNDSDYVVELKEVKRMIGELRVQETLERRLDVQQTLIEKLSTQVDELNRRLAKRQDDDER